MKIPSSLHPLLGSLVISFCSEMFLLLKIYQPFGEKRTNNEKRASAEGSTEISSVGQRGGAQVLLRKGLWCMLLPPAVLVWELEGAS